MKLDVFPKPGDSHRRRTRRSTKPTADEQRYLDWVREQPCVVTGRQGVQIHHVTASIHGGRMSRSHYRVVSLVPELHQIIYGPADSVEALGHGGFYHRWSVDLLEEAKKLRTRYLDA